MIKNEEDEGWAVAMIKDGEPEPALVGPFNAFNTLVKTASEVLRRHEQQLHAQLHKNLFVATDEGQIKVMFDIVPDEEHPYAELSAYDADGEQIAKVRTSAAFKFNATSAANWIEGGYRRP